MPYDFDLFVIGGGSGGVRAGRLVAGMGKRVGVAEEFRFGGTCVIRGCVPKKLFVYASQFPEHFEDSAGYGWNVGDISFNWKTLIENKDSEITRLEGLYQKGLDNNGATMFKSRAELIDNHTICLTATGEKVTAERILVAVGGRPNPMDTLPGHDLCISSNEAFDLDELPESILIAGGGYIAVEFANIFHGLGVKTTLIYRGKEVLSRFDKDLRTNLQQAMIDKGINFQLEDVIESVKEGSGNNKLVKTRNGDESEYSQVMLALGRIPNTYMLGLDKAGVEINDRGAIKVDEYSKTSADNIYAVGDVTDKVQLTPVAIHEAMCFVESVYRDNPTSPDHELIPTAVFSQPEIGTVGMSEEEASKAFDELEIYRAQFRPMRHTLSGRSEKMLMKLIVNAADRKVVGAHILGPDAGELAQVLGVTLKAGCTKDDFDRTMALHPSASEELVTMYTPTYRVKGGERI